MKEKAGFPNRSLKKVTDIYKSVVTDFTEMSVMVKADVTQNCVYVVDTVIEIV